jgi:hypothetical protein
MSLTRDQILAADDLPREAVDVPEWGGRVFVRTLNGLQRDGFETAVKDKAKVETLVILAVRTVCDETGNLLFSDADVAALLEKNADVVLRICEVALRVNAINKTDIDELEKNSSAIPSDTTPSDSPNASA